MATEALGRRSPLESLAPALASVAGPRFSCVEEPYRTLTDVRCAAAAITRLASTLGGVLPPVGSSASYGALTILALGERWWLVDAPDGSDPVTGSDQVSAVDVSAQYACLRLRGACARDVLSHGMPIDIHEDHFREGAVAQTLLAKSRVILARCGRNEYRVWVPASYSRYVAIWLVDASVEYRGEG